MKILIGIATIALLILGVGSVFTKAETHVAVPEVVGQTVSVTVDEAGVFVAVNGQPGLGRVDVGRVNVEPEGMRVFDVMRGDYVRRDVAGRHVVTSGNELRSSVKVYDMPAFVGVDNRGVLFDSTNQHNPARAWNHLKRYSRLAVRDRRVPVSLHLLNDVSVLCADVLANVSVPGRMSMAEAVRVADVVVAPVPGTFEVRDVQRPLSVVEVKALTPVPAETVAMNRDAVELNLAVV